MAKTKGLTRPIKRSQATAYDVIANANPPRGVTHLLELNARGAYERHYVQAREFLDNEGRMYTAKQKSAMRKMSPKRRAVFKKMLAKSPGLPTRRARSNKKKKRAPRRTTAMKTGLRRAKATPAYKRAATKRPLKRGYIAKQMKKGRSKKQAEADWKLAYGRRLKKGRQTRTYGKGKYKAARARYAGTTRWTYKSKSKSGRTVDIPDYALLGYPSSAALRKVYKSGSDRERAALSRKLQKLQQRRERDAGKAAARIRRGKGVFSPNADEILSFEEWNEMARMRPNKQTRKQRAASLRNLKKARAARGGKKRKTTKRRTVKRRTVKRKTTKRRTGWTKAKRVAAGKKAARTRKRRRKAGTTRKATRRRKVRGRKKVRRARRGRGRMTATTRRKISLALKRYHRTCRKTGRKPARRRTKRRTTKRRSARRNQGSYAYNIHRRNQGSYAYNTHRRNKHRSYRANKHRGRSYGRNVGGAAYLAELKGALKLGVLVAGGYMAHRALTHVFDQYALAKIEAFNTGTLAKYRGLISGVIVAALGVPLTVRVMPKQAVPVAAGMAASLIQGAIVTALAAADQANVAAYLSNYPNAEGRMYGHAIGSYYTFKPHEVYPGMGSYYTLPQMQGFGIHESQLTQAAAGMGQAQLTQAAAGMGQIYQAAAGMGEMQLTQAAAGTGEYIATGVQGIGEYEEVGVSHRPTYVDEGIHPNLHAAEQALSVAEGQAGIGDADVPLQSTVNPTVIADPISDLPGGSRAGVFQGGDGIFG